MLGSLNYQICVCLKKIRNGNRGESCEHMINLYLSWGDHDKISIENVETTRSEELGNLGATPESEK